MIRQTATAILPIVLLAGCGLQRPSATTPQTAPVAQHGLVDHPPAAPAPAPAPAPPVAGAIHIFRGVKTVQGSAVVDWSATSFGVSGVVPTLSFFRTIAQGVIAVPQGISPPQCWIDISVAVPDVTTPVGIQGMIAVPANVSYANANLQYAFAHAGPWAVRFDDQPDGHWSIDRATFGDFNPGPPVGGQARAFFNGTAGRIAAAAFREMAIPTPVADQPAVAVTVTVVDGTVQHCRAQ